jgi:predicted secreted hydrolase
MLYLIRDPAGEALPADESIVGPDGELTMPGAGDFYVTPIGAWTSPATGTTYPSGWVLEVRGHGLTTTVTPTLPEQEFDTRPTTWVIYWEGEASIAGVRQGESITGRGSVELTGYAPSVPLDLATPETSTRTGVLNDAIATTRVD